MQLEAAWKIVGVVTEARELKSEKNATWRGYVCKVATVGLTAELQLDAAMFKEVGAGQQLEFRGRFEDNKGILRLFATEVRPVAAAKGGAA